MGDRLVEAERKLKLEADRKRKVEVEFKRDEITTPKPSAPPAPLFMNDDQEKVREQCSACGGRGRVIGQLRPRKCHTCGGTGRVQARLKKFGASRRSHHTGSLELYQ